MAPWTVWVSDVQTSAVVVLTIASSGPGSGIGFSIIPTRSIPCITKARMVSGMAALLPARRFNGAKAHPWKDVAGAEDSRHLEG
jgi:hypothetical protein